MAKKNDRGSTNQKKVSKLTTFEKVDKAVTAVKKGVDVAKGVFDFLKFVTGRGGNDPSWYTHYPVDGLVGANYAVKRGFPIGQTPLVSAVRISVDLVKPIGEGEAAWNQAISYLYATLRAANTSNVAYTPYDLEKYIFNVRAFRYAYAHLRRAFSICRTISPSDISTPQVYMRAAYVGDDYLEDLANVKQFGNMLSIKLARLAPIIGDLFTRTEWLLSCGYLDSNTNKAVPYIFGSDKVAYLSPSANGQWIVKEISLEFFDDFCNDINTAIDEFINYPPFSLIAGDIMRTFGEESITPLEVWSDDAEFPFVYNEEVLRQINNIKCSTWTFRMKPNLTVVSDTGYLQESITASVDPFNCGSPDYIVSTLNSINEEIVINARYVNGPSPADILVDTRLTPAFHASLNQNTQEIQLSVIECGTEFVSKIDAIYRRDNDSINYESLTNVGIASGYPVSTLYNVTRQISMWSQVDWMPQMNTYVVDYDNESFAIGAFIWDIDKYAIVTPHDIGVYHSYAVLSLLHANLKARITNASDIEIKTKNK